MHLRGRVSRRVCLMGATIALMAGGVVSYGTLARDSQLAASFGAVGGQQACKGRCLDPHPGQFKSWYGQRNGCWVQVWRQWPEGCTHYQMFNSCENRWETKPNGAARVYWTCCVH